MMSLSQWEEEEQCVIQFLDTIDILEEMVDGEELLSFMERLDEKHTYATARSTCLFDCFGPQDFEEYLWRRYGTQCVYEVVKMYVQKSQR